LNEAGRSFVAGNLLFAALRGLGFTGCREMEILSLWQCGR